MPNGEDHDLLLRIDERVKDMHADVKDLVGVVANHSTRLVVLESRRAGLTKWGWVAVGAVLLLVVTGAITLDMAKAKETVDLVSPFVPGSP